MKKSAAFFENNKINDQYFQISFKAMIDSRPLLKRRKKNCYNYKCKHQKQFMFDKKYLT